MYGKVGKYQLKILSCRRIARELMLSYIISDVKKGFFIFNF